mgnify:CR=1 FL=1
MASIERLDAIATGILGLVAGGVVLALTTGFTWDTWQQLRRQTDTTGVVIRLEKTQVCQNIGRSNPWRCDRKITKQCPIVQYQPETGAPLPLKACHLTLAVGDRIEVVYDEAAPADAKVMQPGVPSYDWAPLLISSVPVGVGLMLVAIGAAKLWEGTHPDQA